MFEGENGNRGKAGKDGWDEGSRWGREAGRDLDKAVWWGVWNLRDLQVQLEKLVTLMVC